MSIRENRLYDFASALKICYFGAKYRNKLCQFKHFENSKNDSIDELTKQFEKLTEMEKRESKEVLCESYCKYAYDYHRCSDEMYEMYIGCDVLNITDDFENDDEEANMLTYLPCEKCDERYDNIEKLKEHILGNHALDKNINIKCCLNECSFSSDTVNVLIKHIGVHHFDVVKKRL